MGLFKKKKKGEKKISGAPASAPELPKLPEFPRLTDEKPEKIHRLPSFPSNSTGTKFSQSSIKEAVTGEEEDEELYDADEFADEDEMRMMQEPLKKPMTREEGMPSRRLGKERTSEPVFIRIDRFEEALRIFNETKRKISEIERVLESIKNVKEKEDKELQLWEKEVKTMKAQIENIDRDIFSKI